MCLGLMMNQGDSANDVDTYLQYLQDVNKLPRHANYVKTRSLNPARILSYPIHAYSNRLPSSYKNQTHSPSII